MTTDLTGVLAELVAREPLFHNRALVGNAEQFDAETAPGFWEVGASGQVYSRDFIRSVVLKRLAEGEIDVSVVEGWKIESPAVSELGADTYLFTYQLTGQGRQTRRATIWRKSSELSWCALYHQGTVIAQE
jgi:hypothetical protein